MSSVSATLTENTLQGDCAAAPPTVANGPPLGDVAPGQCVLNVTAGLIVDRTAGKQLWLNNLLVRFADTETVAHLMRLDASEGTEPAGLWLTHVTFVGGGLAYGVSVTNATLFAAGALP